MGRVVDDLPRGRICPLLGRECVGEKCAFAYSLDVECDDGDVVTWRVCLVILGMLGSAYDVDVGSVCREAVDERGKYINY